MLNTSLVGCMPTDPIMEYRIFGDLDFNIYLFEINEPQVECCIPEDSYENPHYKITPRRVALEDQIESNSNFFLSEGLNDEIQKMLSYQKNLSSEDLKYKIHELFEKFLLSEEIEKARELLQLVIKFFPNEKNFVLAKNIIAPPKLVSSAKSEMEGIFETIQFFRNRGGEFKKMWVAVSKGRLLDFSKSYSKLAEAHKDNDVFITKIL